LPEYDAGHREDCANRHQFMIRNIHGTIFAASGGAVTFPEVYREIRQATKAASGAVCVPATCPIERPVPGTHGHSWNMRHGDDLRQRWSSEVQSQPSKLVMRARYPSLR